MCTWNSGYQDCVRDQGKWLWKVVEHVDYRIHQLGIWCDLYCQGIWRGDTGIAVHWNWTDIYEYYVFKLSNREEEIIIQEAENCNWSEMTSLHVNKLEHFESYNAFLDCTYRHHKCYICIYDEQNNQIITNSDNDIYHDTTGWIIFLYDTETNKYYCVFQTM